MFQILYFALIVPPLEESTESGAAGEEGLDRTKWALVIGLLYGQETKRH